MRIGRHGALKAILSSRISSISTRWWEKRHHESDRVHGTKIRVEVVVGLDPGLKDAKKHLPSNLGRRKPHGKMVKQVLVPTLIPPVKHQRLG